MSYARCQRFFPFADRYINSDLEFILCHTFSENAVTQHTEKKPLFSPDRNTFVPLNFVHFAVPVMLVNVE